MKLLLGVASWVVVVAGVGCLSDEADRPIVPQGPPPVIAGDDTDTSPITGRVCRATDLRDRASCAPTGAGGLTVTLGASMATTGDDGSFTLARPATGTNPTFVVTGPGVVPTTTPLSSIPTTIGPGTIQVIDADLYARMLTSNGVMLQDGMGALLTSVTRDGLPVPGVTVATSPASAFGPFYDASSPVTWGLGGTATRGVIWVPGLTAGMVDLSYQSILGGLETMVAGVTVRNGGVTILDTVLPGSIP